MAIARRMISRARNSFRSYMLTDTATIKTLSTSASAFHTADRTFSGSTTIPCRLIRRTGTPKDSDTTVGYVQEYVVKIAYDQSLPTTCRLEINGQQYDVQDVSESTDMFTKDVRVLKVNHG